MKATGASTSKLVSQLNHIACFSGVVCISNASRSSFCELLEDMLNVDVSIYL
jgi:hypothetical protein